MKNIFLLLLVGIFILSGCSDSKKSESETAEVDRLEVLPGKWKAVWNKEIKEEGYDQNAHHMQGTMDFKTDEVEITAYGFDGCIFFADTVVSTVRWKIEDDVIRFIDFSDEQGLPYNIENFKQDKIELSLMDDIYITLSR